MNTLKDKTLFSTGERVRFDAVLFDCDGVLVDSEPISNPVLRDMLEELGWKLSSEDCMDAFRGKTAKDAHRLIEAHTGRPLAQEWVMRFRQRRDERLMQYAKPIRGAVATVAWLHKSFAGRIACASDADRAKIELQLRKCDLMPYFEGRIFSGGELPHSKPAPDVYLAAAAALGVAPSRCVVVEDTATGTEAGVAAGATVVGYSPSKAAQMHGQDASAALLDAGAAVIVADLAQLPSLLHLRSR